VLTEPFHRSDRGDGDEDQITCVDVVVCQAYFKRGLG
jgi:hypothetical protein